MITSTLQIDG